jgi:hypothetical protein
LTGPALTQAAQQQNWDPSVQALVMFPDVLKQLNDDITWTTNLGNAFLAQQQDVMNAVQIMRQQAEQAGRLQSTPQQTVTTTTNAGQTVIVIQPANPSVIYVPVYDPVWIWGPPRWYPYPHWVWPPRTVLTAGLFLGFGVAINVGLFFGTGWHGWGGWGWHPGWAAHTVTVNNVFIHQYNFNTVHINNVHSTTVWTHDPVHRQGVPYASPAVREQYRAPVRQVVAPRAIPEPARAAPARVAPETARVAPAPARVAQEPARATPEPARPAPAPARPAPEPARAAPAPARVAPAPAPERFGNREIPQAAPPSQTRSAFNGMQNGEASRTFAQHGYSSLGPARSAAPAPAVARPAPAAARPAPAPKAPAAARPDGGPKR